MKRFLNELKIIIMVLSIPILLIAFVLYMFYDINRDVKELTAKKDSYIGKRIVINNDTLMIIRRGNIFSDSYYLSDDTEVSQIIVDKTIIK